MSPATYKYSIYHEGDREGVQQPISTSSIMKAVEKESSNLQV